MGRFAPKRLGFGVSKYVFIRVNSLAATRRLKIFNVCSVCDRRSKVIREPFTALVINSSRRLRRLSLWFLLFCPWYHRVTASVVPRFWVLVLWISFTHFLPQSNWNRVFSTDRSVQNCLNSRHFRLFQCGYFITPSCPQSSATWGYRHSPPPGCVLSRGGWNCSPIWVTALSLDTCGF